MVHDIVCYSHLRWRFVYQRPQHLLSRFSTEHRVIFFEEPVYGENDDHYEINKEEEKDIWVITPVLFHQENNLSLAQRMRSILDAVLNKLQVKDHIAWYYTPMALPYSSHLDPLLIVYDCMDELSAFKNAPSALIELEKELFRKADLIFTGGHSLYQHKKSQHHNIHPFPSSIDQDHFSLSRTITEDPDDQAHIPHPRFGFFGVIDERMNMELVREVAERMPDWNFILLGPFAKIDPDQVPKLKNIHYLGQKTYNQLPTYLSGWDVAMMPFALNEATRFISPTKTPEFLAGGKPVISTSIRDVVEPYGKLGLVNIADTGDEFIEAGKKILSGADEGSWWVDVDKFLSGNSWDKTWANMKKIMETTMKANQISKSDKTRAYV
jgi:glycosyltransferase involved in cell wall biosynthesis